MGLTDLDEGTVDSRLVRWGKWKMQSGVALGYPSQAAFMRLVPAHINHDRFGEIDQECVETNDVIELLPYVHQIVVRVQYVLPYNSVAVKAHQCGVCKRSYHNYLAEAKKLFAKKLNDRLHMVHDFDINVLSRSVLRETIS